MRTHLPLLLLCLSMLAIAAYDFAPLFKPSSLSHLNPAEEYLLSKQYPYLGEGYMAYQDAVQKELQRMKHSRGFNSAWQQEGPFNTGGRINCVAIHPTLSGTYLIGCADGGIFKTTNDGATWAPVFDDAASLSVSCIVYDSTNTSVLYAGTGDQVLGGYSHLGHGLYKSTDGGQTWNAIGLQQTGAITKILIDPSNSNIIYAGTTGNPFISDTNRGIYKSIDGGLNWSHVLYLGPNAGIGDLVINAQNPSVLYASGRRRLRSNSMSIVNGPEARLYRTQNGGLTWDTLSNGLPTGDQCRIGLCISHANPNLIYANYVDTSMNFGGLYKSVNGGNSWSLVNNTASIQEGGFGWYFGEIRMLPTNDNTLFILGISVYKSTDGGLSFTDIGSVLHSDKHDLRFDAAGGMCLASDGGLYKSTNGGSNWVNKNNFPITQFYETAWNPWDPANYYGGAQDNGSNYGSNGSGPSNWDHYYGGDGFRPQFNPNDSQIMYAEWQNGNLVASTNAGSFFQDIATSINSVDRCSWNTPYLVSSHNPDVLYFGSFMVYKNIDGPIDNWFPVSSDLTDGTADVFHVITTIDQSPLDSLLLYAGTSDARLWVTQNDGASWSPIQSGLSNRNISCVLASPDSHAHVFVSQTGYRDNDPAPHIYYSTDFGSNWTSIAGNLPNFSINDIWVKPGSHDSSIVIANDAGVYATLNHGLTWDRVGNNMPLIPVFDLDYNPNTKRLVAATFARSMMTMAIDSIFPAASVPDQVPLFRNEISCVIYPNPCQGSCYMKSKTIFESACLYDCFGQVVKRFSGLREEYTLSLEGLPAGLYILSLCKDNQRLNKPIVVSGTNQ